MHVRFRQYRLLPRSGTKTLRVMMVRIHPNVPGRSVQGPGRPAATEPWSRVSCPQTTVPFIKRVCKIAMKQDQIRVR